MNQLTIADARVSGSFLLCNMEAIAQKAEIGASTVCHGEKTDIISCIMCRSVSGCCDLFFRDNVDSCTLGAAELVGEFLSCSSVALLTENNLFCSLVVTEMQANIAVARRLKITIPP